MTQASGAMLKERKKLERKRNFKRMWPLYLIIIPGVIHMLLFIWAPLWGWSIAFFDYFPGRPIFEQRFVGFKYFTRMFKDRYFIQALRNTLCLSGLSLLAFPIAPLFAIFLNELRSSKTKRTIQTLTSFPNFISWILVYSIFSALFSVDDGAFNQIFYKQLGLLNAPADILTDKSIARVLNAIILPVWKGTGWSAILYMAAITGIDTSLYEAAEIDGAGRFKKMFYITLPGIMPTVTTLFIMALAGILNSGFEQYYVFVNRMTFNVLDNLDTYVYRIGLENLNFSYGTALGIVRSIVSLVLLVIANESSYWIRGYRIY